MRLRLSHHYSTSISSSASFCYSKSCFLSFGPLLGTAPTQPLINGGSACLGFMGCAQFVEVGSCLEQPRVTCDLMVSGRRCLEEQLGL